MDTLFQKAKTFRNKFETIGTLQTTQDTLQTTQNTLQTEQNKIKTTQTAMQTQHADIIKKTDKIQGMTDSNTHHDLLFSTLLDTCVGYELPTIPDGIQNVTLTRSDGTTGRCVNKTTFTDNKRAICDAVGTNSGSIRLNGNTVSEAEWTQACRA